MSFTKDTLNLKNTKSRYNSIWSVIFSVIVVVSTIFGVILKSPSAVVVGFLALVIFCSVERERKEEKQMKLLDKINKMMGFSLTPDYIKKFTTDKYIVFNPLKKKLFFIKVHDDTVSLQGEIAKKDIQKIEISTSSIDTGFYPNRKKHILSLMILGNNDFNKRLKKEIDSILFKEVKEWEEFFHNTGCPLAIA